MPRLQKVTEKVFAEIAETSQKKGAYTTFLDIDEVLGLSESNQLIELKSLYKDIVSETQKKITTLAAIEEIIIQIRCLRVIDKELRLSLSRNYIYARSIFYRRDVKINDIRVVVGTTEVYDTDDLNYLMLVETFRDHCILDLTVAMEKEINKNINSLKIIMRDEEIKNV